jgi:hypothetical protein
VLSSRSLAMWRECLAEGPLAVRDCLWRCTEMHLEKVHVASPSLNARPLHSPQASD